jgi:hypothetical protein
MQVVLSHRAAAESKRTKHKLRTSFTAAIASSARLQWALECGLKRKAQYTKPVEIVQDVLKVSADPAEVLAQLIVLHFKAQHADAASKLCAAAVERGDLALLQWLFDHGCTLDAEICKLAFLHGHLDILIWAHEKGLALERESICLRAAQAGHLHVLQWARELDYPWSPGICTEAARNGHLRVLQWARANGCRWLLNTVLNNAEELLDSGTETLVWLQQQSERSWTDDEKTLLMTFAGRRSNVAALQWLREKRAMWPSSFVDTTYSNGTSTNVCWQVAAAEWALTNGHTWADAGWQCKQLALHLYSEEQHKLNASEVFAWAHTNGCPCTCSSSSSESDSSNVQH